MQQIKYQKVVAVPWAHYEPADIIQPPVTNATLDVCAMCNNVLRMHTYSCTLVQSSASATFTLGLGALTSRKKSLSNSPAFLPKWPENQAASQIGLGPIFLPWRKRNVVLLCRNLHWHGNIKNGTQSFSSDANWNNEKNSLVYDKTRSLYKDSFQKSEIWMKITEERSTSRRWNS